MTMKEVVAQPTGVSVFSHASWLKCCTCQICRNEGDAYEGYPKDRSRVPWFRVWHTIAACAAEIVDVRVS